MKQEEKDREKKTGNWSKLGHGRLHGLTLLFMENERKKNEDKLSIVEEFSSISMFNSITITVTFGCFAHFTELYCHNNELKGKGLLYSLCQSF